MVWFKYGTKNNVARPNENRQVVIMIEMGAVGAPDGLIKGGKARRTFPIPSKSSQQDVKNMD